MRVLLDTCVLSELKKPKPHEDVKSFVQNLDSADCFISVITLGELTKGIALLEDGKKKHSLSLWLQELEKNYGRAILPIMAETVRLWGDLTAQAQRQGRIIPVSDGLIAATVKEHGLTLITRNIKDFEQTGAMIENPWD